MGCELKLITVKELVNDPIPGMHTVAPPFPR